MKTPTTTETLFWRRLSSGLAGLVAVSMLTVMPRPACGQSSALESMVENLTSGVQRIVLENRQLQQELERLENLLTESRRELDGYRVLAAQVEPLLEDNRFLRSQLRVARQRVARLKEEVDSLWESGGLTAKEQRLTRGLEMAESARRQLEETVEELLQQRTIFDQRLQTASLEREIANRQSQQYEQQMQAMAEENRRLRRQLDSRRPPPPRTVAEAVAELDFEMQELRFINVALYRERQSLESQLDETRKAIGAQRDMIAEWQRRAAQLEEELEALTDERDGLARRNQEKLRLLRRQEEELARLEQAAALSPGHLAIFFDFNQAGKDTLSLDANGDETAELDPRRLVAEGEEYQKSLRRLAARAMVERDTETAARFLQQILQSSPEDLTSLLALATIRLHQDQAAAALPLLQRASRLDPENSNTLRQLGIVSLSLGQSEKAEASFRKALQIDPEDQVSAYNLALLLAAMEPPRMEEARRWYSQARDLGEAGESRLDRLFHYRTEETTE